MSVDGDVLTVYDDVAPHAGYEDGAIVRASRFYRVISDRTPHSLADHKALDIQEVMKGEVT